MLRKSVRHFYDVQQICDSKTIPFFQIMGMPPSRKVHEKESCRHIIKNPVADEINTNTFIGWPMMTQIDGFSCGSKLYDLDPNRENYDNVHPNKKGQEFITELLYKEVTKNGNI